MITLWLPSDYNRAEFQAVFTDIRAAHLIIYVR
jgi:hypothetical protein